MKTLRDIKDLKNKPIKEEGNMYRFSQKENKPIKVICYTSNSFIVESLGAGTGKYIK